MHANLRHARIARVHSPGHSNLTPRCRQVIQASPPGHAPVPSCHTQHEHPVPQRLGRGPAARRQRVHHMQGGDDAQHRLVDVGTSRGGRKH